MISGTAEAHRGADGSVSLGLFTAEARRRAEIEREKSFLLAEYQRRFTGGDDVRITASYVTLRASAVNFLVNNPG